MYIKKKQSKLLLKVLTRLDKFASEKAV